MPALGEADRRPTTPLLALVVAGLVGLALLATLLGLPSTASADDDAKGEGDRTSASTGTAPPPSPASSPAPSPATAPVPTRPNIVVVVMDDFSMDLLRTMRSARTMRRTGAEYRNAYVVNTLCCPSRAAMMTGRPPHLSGVLTNTSGGPGPDRGGWPAFRDHDGPKRSVNVALRRSGYTTGFVGKYLNEYEPRDAGRTPPPWLPGWDDFEALAGSAYKGWGFRRTFVAGERRLGLRHYRLPGLGEPRRVKDDLYAGTVIGRRALTLLRRYEKADAPFYLHVAPYAPHSRLKPAWSDSDPRFPAAFRDRPRPGSPHGDCGRVSCRRLTLRDLVGYRDPPGDNRPVYLRGGRAVRAPSWRTTPPRTSDRQSLTYLRDRARMVQSVDRTVTAILRTVSDDTMVVLTSDNGFHIGQHSFGNGKGTPYDSDTHVPLLVVGPGVEQGPRDQLVSSIDLAPTFEELAGRTPDRIRAGVSFAPSLWDRAADGSDYTFIEHTYGPARRGEPDAPLGSGGRLDVIPSYVAVRSPRGLLVRLDLDRDWKGTRYAWELYTYRDAAFEKRNQMARLHHKPWVRDLRTRLAAWAECGPAQCRRLVSAD